MAKERVTVNIANVRMKLLTGDPAAVERMAASLNSRIDRLAGRAGCSKNDALVMLIMEQADSQQKSAELIHSQQEQIFELLAQNAALMGNVAESAPRVPAENALLRENAVLRQKNQALLDELSLLKKELMLPNETDET